MFSIRAIRIRDSPAFKANPNTTLALVVVKPHDREALIDELAATVNLSALAPVRRPSTTEKVASLALRTVYPAASRYPCSTVPFTPSSA
jgi:hypothetical protein